MLQSKCRMGVLTNADSSLQYVKQVNFVNMKIFNFIFNLLPKQIIMDEFAQQKIESLEKQIKQFAEDYLELENELNKASKQISELEDIAQAASNIWAGRAAREKLAELIAQYNDK